MNTLKILVMNGIVFFSMPLLIGQGSNFNVTLGTLHEAIIDIEPSVETDLENADFQSKKQLIPGYTMILDSIYEKKNFGYYSELYHWYYSYTNEYKLDTVGRYFYNGKGEIQKITESRKYNSSGQLLKLVRYQPDYEMMEIFGDTAIIDYHTEEYKYQGEKLIWEQTKTRRWEEYDITENYYTYNAQGKLIEDSTIRDYGSNGYNYVTYYLYNSGNNLEYKVEKYDNLYRTVEKYIYEETDTTLLLSINSHYISQNIESLVLDTFSFWHWQNFYFITFDELGRRKSLTAEEENIFEGRSIESRVVFDYTEQNDVLHNSYYTWEGSYEEGNWFEAMRKDYLYDDEGNILLYEKTIYDARTEEWIIDNRKEYYYTPISSVLSVENKEDTRLNLYPNPTNDYLIVGNEFEPKSTFSIYNTSGMLISAGRLENEFIQVSNLEPGLYIILLETESGLHTGKFVKY